MIENYFGSKLVDKIFSLKSVKANRYHLNLAFEVSSNFSLFYNLLPYKSLVFD